MDQLLMIFDKEDVIKGKKVFEDIKKNYKNFQERLNQDNLKMQGFGVYYMYPFLFKEEFDNISDTANALNKITLEMRPCIFRRI